jgi:hypothetical protein
MAVNSQRTRDITQRTQSRQTVTHNNKKAAHGLACEADWDYLAYSEPEARLFLSRTISILLLFVHAMRSSSLPEPADPIKPRPCTALPTTIVLLRRRGGAAATAEATTGVLGELRSESTRGGTLLLVTILATAVATLAVTTGATTATSTALAGVTTEHAARRGVRALLLDVGLGNDLGREVKPLAEVVKTLGGEGVVVPLPRELGLEVATGSQRLASLDDLCMDC